MKSRSYQYGSAQHNIQKMSGERKAFLSAQDIDKKGGHDYQFRRAKLMIPSVQG